MTLVEPVTASPETLVPEARTAYVPGSEYRCARDVAPLIVPSCSLRPSPKSISTFRITSVAGTGVTVKVKVAGAGVATAGVAATVRLTAGRTDTVNVGGHSVPARALTLEFWNVVSRPAPRLQHR